MVIKILRECCKKYKKFRNYLINSNKLRKTKNSERIQTTPKNSNNIF